MNGNLIPFNEKRLANLYRGAALRHIRREYAECSRLLREALLLIEKCDRGNWAPAHLFTAEWERAVVAENRGEGLSTAPAAWIHLSQELASAMEQAADWVGYLEGRWRFEPGRLPVSRRAWYAFLATLALVLSAAILALLARQVSGGGWESLIAGPLRTPPQKLFALVLILGRVAGTALMIESGVVWARRALTGKDGEAQVFFLGPEAGLALADPPAK